jgi:mannose-1-phosphate guanylyltransferase
LSRQALAHRIANVRAIVLVGGEGTRLRPLTLRTLKQLVPVLNRPLLEHLLGHLASHGISTITLAMTRHSEAVEGVFGDGGALGLQLDYVYEETPLGSGGAIAAVASGWQEPFLVCNGDLLTDLDVTAFIASHRTRRAELSITLHEVEDPSPFGVVVLGADERVTRFVEKPPRESAPSRMINAGAWLFEPSLLAEMDGTRFNRVEDGLFPMLAASGRPMFGFTHRGYWLDVGNPQTYLQANLDLVSGAFPARLPAGWPADGLGTAEAHLEVGACVVAPALLGAETSVAEGALLEGPLVTGGGCTIYPGARVSRSVLWDSVIIEEGAQVTDSVLATGARVAAGAHVTGAVLGQGATVGVGERVPPDTRIGPGEQWTATGAA